MPGGDRTGPNGMGAMTGRATGFCSGSGAPGFTSYFSRRNLVYGLGFGRGGGRGFGAGRGRRNMFYANGIAGNMPFVENSGVYPYQTQDAEMESLTLKKYAEQLQIQLNSINKRISDLDNIKAD